MARNRAFSLDLDIDNPTDKLCKQRNGQRAVELDAREFHDMLNRGKLTAMGQLFGGTFPGIAEEGAAAYSDDSEALARKCVVVYVGGTAYRICS